MKSNTDSVQKISKPSSSSSAAPHIPPLDSAERTIVSKATDWPSDCVSDAFWKCCARLTTRTHDHHDNWIGGPEIREWNRNNTSACERCSKGKKKRVCQVENDQPSCIPCRMIKVGCDRKARFLFDMTREKFFSDFQVFMAVYKKGPTTRTRREKRVEIRTRRVQSASKDFLVNQPASRTPNITSPSKYPTELEICTPSSLATDSTSANIGVDVAPSVLARVADVTPFQEAELHLAYFNNLLLAYNALLKAKEDIILAHAKGTCQHSNDMLERVSSALRICGSVVPSLSQGHEIRSS
ncbi:hypothetical protein B0H16DRAFT_1604263 [Mycena metata]|uniref:Zn(2)-C6 fungal-type domain-containing protein n=1 Tax=Mycena metata TaxID=1033252 RepID=A0AAD7HI21_9AGAR|nr:hypothetical protein B0H16DRAFT_1604263 [Mycena metata]